MLATFADNLADHTVRAVSESLAGLQTDMDPFHDSRSNIDQWLGGAPASALSPGAPGRATQHFFVGDDQADSRAIAAGITPHGSSWLRLAKSQLGTPYVWASASPGAGFDCSGFTQWLVKRVTGVSLEHHAATQAQQTQAVSRDNLQPGDLLFFRYGRLGNQIDHVEVYMGGGKMIGTANTTEDLDIDPVDWAHFVQGGRVDGMSKGGGGAIAPGKGGRRQGGGAGRPATAAPLTVPFAVQPQNYFTGILSPMMNQDPKRDPSQGFHSEHMPSSQIQAAARKLVLQHGWTVADYEALVKLWNRESGWDPDAVNKSSGATGIPQLNPNSHDIPKNWSDPMVQVQWGLSYIAQRYGSPSAAWAHSQQTGWY